MNLLNPVLNSCLGRRMRSPITLTSTLGLVGLSLLGKGNHDLRTR